MCDRMNCKYDRMNCKYDRMNCKYDRMNCKYDRMNCKYDLLIFTAYFVQKWTPMAIRIDGMEMIRITCIFLKR